MANNFLETVKDYFTIEFSHQAANSLDESSAGISKALSAIIPLGLAVILRKATSGNEDSDSILTMARESTSYFSTSPNLSNLHNDEKGSDIPQRLFGSHQSQIEHAISQFAGIKHSSASSLMTLALPSILGLLGKHAALNNLPASGLSGFLSSQKDNILQAIPPELSSEAGMLGLDSSGAFTSAISSIKPATTDTTQTVVEQIPGKNKWLVPLIIILAVIALLVYFSRGCNNTRDNTTFSTIQQKASILSIEGVFPSLGYPLNNRLKEITG